MAQRTAFVLGGGGVLGAAEVGMLRALLGAGITPDLIVGTSIGALNGALLAADPSPTGVARLQGVWTQAVADGPLSRSLRSRVSAIAAHRARAASHPGPLIQLLEENLAVRRIEDLQVEFSCVAASIERAAEHWFTEGPIVPAVLASAALPGLFPPVEIDGEHFIDGGIVNSIPLDRARKLGADRTFVLQVGRIEQPLSAPQRPWEVPIVAFEVARRARFHASLARSHDVGLEVHVLPTGGLAPRPTERANFDLFDTSRVDDRIAAAHEASVAYLAEHGLLESSGPVEPDPGVGGRA
jgi:NTE family protein